MPTRASRWGETPVLTRFLLVHGQVCCHYTKTTIVPPRELESRFPGSRPGVLSSRTPGGGCGFGRGARAPAYPAPCGNVALPGRCAHSPTPRWRIAESNRLYLGAGQA